MIHRLGTSGGTTRRRRTMARLFSTKPAVTFRGRKFLGVRGWVGKPSHPPLTDFPIAAYALAAVFDVISFVAKGSHPGAARDAFVAGTYVVIAGFVVSLGAAVTGFWDWWKSVERHPDTGPIGRAAHTQVWRTVNWHATVMVTVTVIALVDIVVRLAQFDQGAASLAVMVLSVAAGVLVAYGATFGGSLVFDDAFDVESQDGSTVWDETERDEFPAERLPSDKS
jgi:uncharacterized membrane protein